MHELGHALVAMRLLDAEVELTVGSIGKVLEAQWGSLQVRVNALGGQGQGQGSLDGARATARDMLLISLAGPAASACGLAVTRSPWPGFRRAWCTMHFGSRCCSAWPRP